MKLPPWLRRDRQTDRPALFMSEASLGNLGVSFVIFVIIAAIYDVRHAAPAAVFGLGIIVISTLATWLVTLLVTRLGQDPALFLLVGYVIKIMVGAALLLVVPFPQSWSAAWALAAAIWAVVTILGTQLWVIGRLRIPYFSSADSVPTRHSGKTNHCEGGKDS